MDLQLHGLSVLVTGGTRGIGRAIVEQFLAEGAAVAFCARDADGVQKAQEQLGGRAIGTALDVADAAALANWVNLSAEQLGGIDIVVSNVSALAIPDEPDNWTASFEVDLMGAVRLVNAAMPYLEASDAASIVAVSSVSGREIDFAAGPYGTLKAALIHYLQGLANQLAAKGIRANSVSPGNVYFEGGVWQSIEQNQPEFFQVAMDLNPTKRMATPEEIARTVVFVASPASSRTSGANILVDGALSRGVQF
ncbi:MAG TPA: SDR family oxidoreductase [Jatrophihabitans sp.]|uniref:SDR family NAD(P)-dependent oxidoreductase n=1 Tax=Jatrophihabitans sp. TaxID=1932789 RepID=UPI002E0A1CAF|nr:SDR family oxidoreductase [Jatrophihabitans sp.]